MTRMTQLVQEGPPISLNPTDASFAGTFDSSYPSHRFCARGLQNTSSDFTKDSISLWCSGMPTTGMLCAWIDVNFRWASSGVSGTRFGGGHGRLRGATSPLTFRDSNG